jgi:hypothetical protein
MSGFEVFFCCQISCKVVLDMLPDRWAWSSHFGRALVKASSTGTSIVLFPVWIDFATCGSCRDRCSMRMFLLSVWMEIEMLSACRGGDDPNPNPVYRQAFESTSIFFFHVLFA